MLPRRIQTLLRFPVRPLALLLILLMPPPATAQPAEAAPVPEHETLEAVIAELEDPARREAFLERLRILARNLEEPKAEPTAVDTAAGDLLRGLSAQVEGLTERVAASAADLHALPSQWQQLKGTVRDRDRRRELLDAGSGLAATVAGAYAAMALFTWVLQRPRRRARALQGDTMSERCAGLLANFLLELLPTVAFAAAGYLLLASVDADAPLRIVALAWINAAVLLRALLAVSRLATAPAAPRLRLLEANDEAATGVDRWLRRLLFIGVYGYFALQAAMLLGLTLPLYRILSDLLAFVAVALLATATITNRSGISALIRGPVEPGDAPGLGLARLRHALARLWPLLAGLYLLIVLAVWTLEVPGGAFYLARGTVLTLATFVIAHILRQGLDRALALAVERARESGPEAAAGDSRLRRFAPLLGSVGRALLYLLAAFSLLEAWGIDSFGWLAGDTGRSLSGSLLRIVCILVAAQLLWHLATLLLERWLAGSGRGEAQSARTLTLLGVARNALLVLLTVVTTLMILPELGINIAPLLAGAGVLGLAIGFGAQRLVQDVITGVFILLQDLMSVGDVVQLGDRVGGVEAITIRTVRLRDLSGTVHTIPFSAIDTVSNLTKDFSFHVFDLGVAYREDVDEVMRLIHEVGAELRADPELAPLILEDLEIFGVDAFGDSAVVIKGRIKTRPIRQWQVGRAFNRLIKQRFDSAGIEIPFPHRTLYFGEDKAGDAPALRLAAADAAGTGAAGSPP